MFHDKLDGISSSLAAKTLIDIQSGRNCETGRLFVMKRAEAFQVFAGTLQIDKIAHHLLNLSSIKNFLYCAFRDHDSILRAVRQTSKFYAEN